MIDEANINSARAAQQGMRRSGLPFQEKKGLNDIFLLPDTRGMKDAYRKYAAEQTSGPNEFGNEWGGEIGAAIGGYFGGPVGRLGGRMVGQEAGGTIAQGLDDVFHTAPNEFEDAVKGVTGVLTGGSSKIVCTAMNNHYGFGKFRQTIWLQQSTKLHPAYEKGYHTLCLPLIELAYKKQIPFISKPIQVVLEHIVKHRTIDIRAEMRNKKRDMLGRLYRAIFEPICYCVGKWKLRK